MRVVPVTVIIPVHNGADYLSRAFDSVRAQTVMPFEVIFVNDGSTDGSAELIDELRVTSEFSTRVLTHENRGQSASRNAAAEVAKGEYLAFLDQDDLWRPRHLEALVAELDENPESGWAYTDFDEIDLSGNIVTRNFMHVAGVTRELLTVTSILERNCMIIPSASLIRTVALRSVDGFDPELRGYEDDDLFYRLFRAGWRSNIVAESLTAFRVHANSSSTRGIFRESRLKFFAKLVHDLPDDVRLSRYYVSDIVRPRFLHSTLSEYSVALNLHQHAEARVIAATLKLLYPEGHLGFKRRMGISVLRKPRLTRALLRFNKRLPRFLRLPFPALLYLRNP
jgi:glycosyltransferase involved in cell wall biosynthesis